jgi:hypothetical protein
MALVPLATQRGKRGIKVREREGGQPAWAKQYVVR